MFSAFQTFGKLGALASSVARAWSPAALFAAGEAGGLWDFSTLANLYQDSAGTTPCTAVGDPIGKVLDTSGRGNHLTQATSTKRPVLGRMPATGVRNLLTYTEDFSAWSQNITSVNSNKYTAPDGSLTADELVADGYNASRSQTVVLSASQYTLTFSVRAGTSTAFRFGLISGGWLPASASIVSGSGAVSGTGLMTLTGLDSNWTVISLTATATAASTGFFILPGPFPQSAGDSIGVWGAQLELGSTATAYQKVGAAYDVTESGVASVYTAYFDGVDDCLVSPSIDFSGTDAMSVFAGFRKTSDAARGMVAELSATTDSNNGSFALTAPNAASATIVYESKGTSLTDTSATIAAPADSVIAAVSDISADSNVLRRNGAEAESDTGDQGTGNFGNYPIYVGQRGAASLPYKGFLSALCTRGAATDAALVTNMEKWMAARTPGVTLP